MNKQKPSGPNVADYQKKLEEYLDATGQQTQAINRELNRQQNLFAAAKGMEDATKERLKTEQQLLNDLEEESRRATLQLVAAKQQYDRLMQAYNQKLEDVKQLHNRIDQQIAEKEEQQRQVKKLLADWQQQNILLQKQQRAARQIVDGAVDDLPPLQDLQPQQPSRQAAEPANCVKSGKDHANADFWEKKQHTALKLKSLPQDENTDENADNQTNEEPKQSKTQTLFSYLVCIGLAVLLAFAVRTWVLMPTIVSGTSMLPTLQPYDKLLTTPLPYWLDEPQRGDIVVFQAPNEAEGVFYVKRVIGLPGENIRIEDGMVFINDVLLKETYLDNTQTAGYINTQVPVDEVFVLGDNRTVSHDSRDSDVGCIAYEDICGQAVWRIYPFESFGSIK